MIKIDVFDKIDDVSHIDTFEQQLFHYRDSKITTTDVIKCSTFKQQNALQQGSHNRQALFDCIKC